MFKKKKNGAEKMEIIALLKSFIKHAMILSPGMRSNAIRRKEKLLSKA